MTILWWHWLVVGLVLALGEVITPGGFYILFFGVGAIAVGLLARVDLAGPESTQLLLFTVLSVGSLLFFRTRLLRWMQIDPQTPAVDTIVGEVAIATMTIAPEGIGKVELRGSMWSARNVSDRPIAAGARCRVVRVDGLMLDVTTEGTR